MRISDWSSDVCSSDLIPGPERGTAARDAGKGRFACRGGGGGRPDRGVSLHGRSIRRARRSPHAAGRRRAGAARVPDAARRVVAWRDRKSVGEGKRVSVRVDLGGRRIIKKKKQH